MFPRSVPWYRKPVEFCKLLWPEVELYNREREILRSLVDYDTTECVAANMMGKDYTAARGALWFFLTRHPCRIVTTSVDGTQLQAVLWGEIRNAIQTSKYPLEVERGGPLIVNHLHLKKMHKGEECGLSYCLGRVAAKGEGMLGHHIANTGDGVPRTLFVADEASGVDDENWSRADTWAQRKLAIGNAYNCTNFFYKDVMTGSVHPFRNIIRITAEESPNVRLALAQMRRGEEPTGETVLEGVLPWHEYLKRRKLWSVERQTIGLDARFYAGSDLMLFPEEYLTIAERRYAEFASRPRRAKAIGIDPGEGSENTSMAAVDEYGLLEMVSKLTPDTAVVPDDAVAFMHRHGVSPECVAFDRGGGGKQHADVLRRRGYKVTTVAFGESVQLDIARQRAAYRPFSQRLDQRESRYAYINRRAQMYGMTSLLVDPQANTAGFALPPESLGTAYSELRRQLKVMPKLWDQEGRLRLPPKSHRPGQVRGERSLSEILGCSPNESDALVLAVYRMLVPVPKTVAGATF